MSCKHFLLVCATLSCFCIATVAAQNGVRDLKIPVTRFTCQGRASGYYADIETGCQVYHMCDGLGRQFSYRCPNTTLFQQRMLICDHWYMVNCSNSENDYDANLLIGQRDKPFVSEAEMQFRTPRPDILSVPPNRNYYDGLRESESKFSVHPDNSIVGVADIISSANNNGLDSAKHNNGLPTSWSTGTAINNRPNGNVHIEPGAVDILNQDNLAGAASQEPSPTLQSTPADGDFIQNTGLPNITPPTRELRPPRTTEYPSSEDFDIDARMREPSNDPVHEFIKRFDPNSPDSHKTAMSKSEIMDLNQHLPTGQVSAEEERTPRKNKNVGDNSNRVKLEHNKDFNFKEGNRFDSVNIKPTTETEQIIEDSEVNSNRVPVPDKVLLPPKNDFSKQPSTTTGPPVYYEWKWAVPALDLEPPKEGNVTNSTEAPQARSGSGKSPFREVTRSKPITVDPTPTNTEYNISSYFVPDYVFPLDKPHVGYNDENAETSFQVKVGRPGRASYGENPACPHCHPAYLKPGSCEPCIVKR